MNELYLRLNNAVTKKRFQHNILEERKFLSSEYRQYEVQIDALFFEYQKTRRDYEQLQSVFAENEMTQILPEFKSSLNISIQECFKRLSRLIDVFEYEIDILTELFDELINEQELDDMMNKKLDKFINLDELTQATEDVPKTKETIKRNFKSFHKVPKIKPLSKKQSKELVPCHICFEDHKKIDCVTTSCNHTFGKECFYDLLECPMCSEPNPSYFEYRQRGYTKKNPNESIQYIVG